jgi:type I restriction enzyme, S subunit
LSDRAKSRYASQARWDPVPLGELLLDIRNGLTAPQEKEPPGIPVTRIETISKGVVDMDRVRYIRGRAPAKLERFRLKCGDVLFSHIAQGGLLRSRSMR